MTVENHEQIFDDKNDFVNIKPLVKKKYSSHQWMMMLN